MTRALLIFAALVPLAAQADGALPAAADAAPSAVTAVPTVQLPQGIVPTTHAPGADVPAPPAATSLNDPTYQSALKRKFPLSPEQIQNARDVGDQTRAALHAAPQPVMQSRTVTLDLSPGATVPQVYVTPGYVSSITFEDASGAPWPITSVTVGQSRYFSVAVPAVKPANLITVSALGDHLASNIAVTLVDHSTPVIIALATNPDQAAVLTALRANSKGPLASSPEFHTLPTPGTDATLQAFLDQTPPDGAQAMKTPVAGVQAWLYQNRLYVRSLNLVPIWPAYISTTKGPDGTQVFELQKADSLLCLIDGRKVNVDFSPAPTLQEQH